MTTVPVSVGSVHRYTGFTHYVGEESAAPIEAWLKERFEVFVVHSRETAKSGPHVQWYGETMRPWSKQDTNVHGARGQLGQYMPSKMPVKGAKRYSHEPAKKPRERNCEYVAKGGVMVYMTDGDPEDYVGRWKANERRRGRQRLLTEGEDPRPRETFQEKLLRIWDENGQPKDHYSIFMMLGQSRMVPWNNYSGPLLWKASDWLLSQVNMEVMKDRLVQMYEDQSRRMNG